MDKKDYTKIWRKSHPNYQKEWRKANEDKYKAYFEAYKNKNRKKYLLLVQKGNKKRYKKAQQIIHILKINGCAICGYNKCDVALDFHHTNPKDKEFQINCRGVAFKDIRVINELNKCILLCSNCHREIEEKERLNE